jgi:hypothetical protein
MRQTVLAALCLGLPALAFSGCAQPCVARYVYQDGEFGVIGIPVNTYQEKMDFRTQAEALMARHFPDGYEIVRAEEVNEGQRILDRGRKSEIDSEPQVNALNQMIKLGKLSRTTSFEEKETLQVRECRIVYKRRAVGAPRSTSRFAALASLTPPLYIDPNEAIRHQGAAQVIAKSNPVPKRTADPEMRKASVDPAPVNPILAIPGNPVLR